MMQPTQMEHFAELRQLLQPDNHDNHARQVPTHHFTRSQAALASDRAPTASSRPPRGPTTTSTAIAAHRPRPSTRPPPFLPSVEDYPSSSRHYPANPPASRSDVSFYLAQRQQQQQQQQQLQQQQLQQQQNHDHAHPDPHAHTHHRRAKRGKPMARRSLQALFDAAAEDCSTWMTSVSGGDTEDDADNMVGCKSTATTSDFASGGSGGGSKSQLMGPSTPGNCDSGLGIHTQAHRRSSSSLQRTDASMSMEAGEEEEELEVEAAASAPPTPTPSPIPLHHLLMSERGQRLTVLEVKAIILRVAEDLAALHAADMVHRRVAVDAIHLTTNTNTSTIDIHHMAVATLPRGRSAAPIHPSSRCYWALRDLEEWGNGFAPPEVTSCPLDRPTTYTPAGDMWSLGIVLFSVLTGGRLLFGEAGVGADLAMTTDAVQRGLTHRIATEIDAVNKGEEGGGCGGIDAGAKALLMGLLRADPAQRLTAVDVVNHPWVAEVASLIPTDVVLPQVTPKLQREQQQQQEKSTWESRGAEVTRRTQKLDISASDTSVPYPILGYLAQPIEMNVEGKMVTFSAMHAVYSVPGHGPMMSAEPVALADPRDVAVAMEGKK